MNDNGVTGLMCSRREDIRTQTHQTLPSFDDLMNWQDADHLGKPSSAASPYEYENEYKKRQTGRVKLLVISLTVWGGLPSPPLSSCATAMCHLRRGGGKTVAILLLLRSTCALYLLCCSCSIFWVDGTANGCDIGMAEHKCDSEYIYGVIRGGQTHLSTESGLA